jgi:hypothetical protein
VETEVERVVVPLPCGHLVADFPGRLVFDCCGRSGEMQKVHGVIELREHTKEERKDMWP